MFCRVPGVKFSLIPVSDYLGACDLRFALGVGEGEQ